MLAALYGIGIVKFAIAVRHIGILSMEYAHLFLTYAKPMIVKAELALHATLVMTS
jgi:hypothetical protein